MNAGTMGRDEAVEVLAALVDFVCAEMRGLESKPKLKAAIATLRAQSPTEERRGLAEAWRDVAIFSGNVLDEIREIVGLTGKPGNVVEAVRKLAALRAQGEPVVAGWQYRRAGSDDAWTNGTEYGNHQQNTEADPEWETRLVYAFPHAHPAPQQPAPPVVDERTSNARGDARRLVAKLAAHVRPTCSELWHEAQAFLAAEGVQAGEAHPDDAAVDAFAAAMKEKLAAARAKGRGGWNGNEPGMQQRLSDMLRAHVEKGDPRDVANFCMFLHQRGESILSPQPAAVDGAIAWARPVYARPLYATETAEGREQGEVVDIEFHNRPEKPEGEGWRPLVFAAPLPSQPEVKS